MRGLPGMILFVALSIVARANMASPIIPGNGVGELSGSLRDLVILDEHLLIDLRPLATGADSALVAARYRVRNDGPGRALQLLFVAVAMRDRRGTVTLDGHPIPSERADPREIPLRWRPPATTPPLDEGRGLPYEVREDSGLLFTVMLPPGEHSIAVEYRAQVTCQATSENPLRYWQLAYVLSPAREWGGFGALDLTILLPPNWRSASDPPLERHGDSLVGRWDHLPSDAIALTLQAPHGNGTMAWMADVAIDLILLIGGLYGCIKAGATLGRRRARGGIPSILALPVGIVLGIIWGAAVMLGASLHHGERVITFQRSWSYGYGRSILWMFLALVAVVAGMVVTQVAASVAARRWRRGEGGASIEADDRAP